MTRPATEFEFEALPELEGEFEYELEFEGELEGEYESEQFFRRLLNLARNSPAMRRIGRAARTAAFGARALGLSMHPLPMPAVPTERPAIVEVAEPRRRGSVVQPPDPEMECEFEGESEMNPIRRVYPDALMEHFGHAAAEAETEAEAEAFIGAMIPMAARIFPRVAPAILRAAPRLIQGASRVARVLRSSPATRSLVRTIPTIVRSTAATIARRVARGQPVTPQVAVRALAGQAARVLGNPRQAVRAWQRSRALDRRYHHAAACVPRPRRIA